MAYIDLVDFKNAIINLNKSIKINPNNADAYFCRGIYYYNQK